MNTIENSLPIRTAMLDDAEKIEEMMKLSMRSMGEGYYSE